MSKRIMGKASFAEMQDSAGRIQLYFFNRDETYVQGRISPCIMMSLKSYWIWGILSE